MRTSFTASHDSIRALFPHFIISVIATLIVSLVWLLIINTDRLSAGNLFEVSEKARLFFPSSDTFFSPGLILSIAAIFLLSLLFSRHKMFSLGLATCAFACQEISIFGIGYFSIFIRYAFMAFLVASGIFSLIKIYPRRYTVLQILAIISLGWIMSNIIINGSNALSLAYLPIQITLMVGVFIGLSQYFSDMHNTKSLCIILGWLGVAFTILHLLALIFYSDSFINSRFRSVMPLATNFANSYVLLFISMFWLALYKRGKVTYILWPSLCIGLVLIILSGTRNSFLAIGLATIIYSFHWKSKAILRLTLITAILSIMILMVRGGVVYEGKWEAFSERIISFQTSSTRIDLWRMSWLNIKENPFFGYGLGNEDTVLSHHLPKWLVLNSHNAYLGTWLQLGFIGLFLLMLFYFCAFQRGIKLLKQEHIPRQRKSILILPFTILSVLFLSGVFEQNLSSRGSIQQFLWSVFIVILIRVPFSEKKSFQKKAI